MLIHNIRTHNEGFYYTITVRKDEDITPDKFRKATTQALKLFFKTIKVKQKQTEDNLITVQIRNKTQGFKVIRTINNPI